MNFQNRLPVSLLFLFILSAVLISPAMSQESGSVLVLEISGAITPVTDDIVADAISIAEAEGHQALIITLNTPGGGLDETLRITEMIPQTSVPVIGYVYPEGTQAWSAGTLILISTDVAAMAPFTVIGSAQPVSMTPSGSEPVTDTKIVNALVERATENARMHGRNETAAREFITENLNLNAQTALDYEVIEYVAPSMEDLLVQVNGLDVKGSTLQTAGSDIVYYEAPIRLAFMNIISNPVVSSLLLLLGVYAVIFGISNPGFGAEIFGVVAIVMALIGTGFDVNIGAVFLILVGVALLALELQSPGIGVFGIAGMVCIVAGSILLAPTEFPRNYSPAEFQRTVVVTVVVPTILVGLFLLFAMYKVLEVRKRKPQFGGLLGETAVVHKPISPEQAGYVIHRGEYWKARSPEALEKGEKVVILEKDGVMLTVERLRSEAGQAGKE
ncbi:NfeD family protein [Methanolobus chelungpuianus]|uniref:Nodulation protein NfeD n=1 Tax=Methanolobus chelungpuianus TaxID=502115 RepID=A0AAE3H9I6_9EURY|nr:nodulation protein NfeD [Methanolobus chelungpuianus]MCQ6962430.1 nodulation protein NfeD [Methanolobus chelungpuianus]